MAFDPNNLSVSVDTIGGGSMRIHFYTTADDFATITAAGYMTLAARIGVRVGDVVIVSSTADGVYVCEVVSMDANGAATLALDITYASQPEAEAGALNNVGMTPLRTRQHGDARYAQLTDARLTDDRTPTDGSVTEAKIVDGAVTTAKLDDASVTDAKVAAPSLLRNRNLDQAFITDFMTSSEQNDLRAGTQVDVAGAITDAEAALNGGGVLWFRKGRYLLNSGVVKSPSTWWRGPKTNSTSGAVLNNGAGAFIRTQVAGTAITMSGAGVGSNYRGGIDGIGFRGNLATYPNQVLISMQDIVDHHFEDLWLGEYLDGIYALDCKALNFRRFYGFGTTQDNIRLEGTVRTDNTDHLFNECQFSGERYGLYILNGVTANVFNCRPQVSDTTNLRFENVNYPKVVGNYNDSAVSNGSGVGIQIINCIETLIMGVLFYQNDPGSSGDIQVITSAGNNTTGLSIIGCQFAGSDGGTHTGVNFGAPTGGGILNRVILIGNDFSGCDVAVTGLANISSNLRAEGNIVPDSSLRKYQAVDAPTTDQTPEPHVEVFRITGTLNTSFNVDIPAAGNFVDKRIRIVRAAGGTGTVTVRGPNGATVGTLTAAGAIEAICTTSSTTAASVVYVAI